MSPRTNSLAQDMRFIRDIFISIWVYLRIKLSMELAFSKTDYSICFFTFQRTQSKIEPDRLRDVKSCNIS